MTKCNQCDVVDLGVSIIIKEEEEYEICPNCGEEDSVEEIDEYAWIESLELDEADQENEVIEEHKYEDYN